MQFHTLEERDWKELEKTIQEGFKAIQLDLSRDEFLELSKFTSPDDWKKGILDELKSLGPWRAGLLLFVGIILSLCPFPDCSICNSIKNLVFWEKLVLLALFALFLASFRRRGDKGPLSKKECDRLERKLRRAGELARIQIRKEAYN